MQHLTKTEYIKDITALLKETDDEVLLAFILNLLKKSSLHKTS